MHSPTEPVRTVLASGVAMDTFLPERSRGEVVVIAPATGVAQRFYRHFAAWLAGHGHTVVTFDYTGIGASRPARMRTCTATARSWAEQDLTNVVEHVHAAFAPTRLTVLGHSVGGQLVGLCRAQDKIDALVLVAAQLGYWKWWPPEERAKLRLRWFVVLPLLIRLFGYFPGKRLRIMEDLPGPMALEWSRWGRSPNYLFDHIPDAAERYAALRVPCLIWSFTDDRDYAPKQAVDELAERLVNCTITREHLAPQDLGETRIGHFGFFRRGGEARCWPALRERMERSPKQH